MLRHGRRRRRPGRGDRRGRRGVLRGRRPRRAARRRRGREPRLRQPARRRRPARGRDRTRPGLRRGYRRAAVRAPGRPDRQGVRGGHDRRDARPGPLERQESGRDERRVRQGHHRGRPAARRVGGRRDLQLRDQPVDRQARRVRRGHRLLRPGGRFGVSDVVAEDHLDATARAERGSYVGCIAGALSISEYRDGLASAGFSDITITPTHQVADGMHSAIIRRASRQPMPAAASTPAALRPSRPSTRPPPSSRPRPPAAAGASPDLRRARQQGRPASMGGQPTAALPPSAPPR